MLHPSLTTWCIESSSTWSSSPSRSSAARKSGPAERSNGPPRLLAGAPPDRRLAIRLAEPDRSSTGRANPPKGAITCTGEPSTSANVVRSAS
jgi:hypothetical protein